MPRVKYYFEQTIETRYISISPDINGPWIDTRSLHSNIYTARLPWSRRVNSSGSIAFRFVRTERNSRIEIRFIGTCESENIFRSTGFFSSSRYLIQRIYVCSNCVTRRSDIPSLLSSSARDSSTIYPLSIRFGFGKEIQEARTVSQKGRKKKKRGGGEGKKEKWQRERERERKGGNDCFTMTDTCSPSSTNYELFEFVRVLRVSSIFLARTRPIRTRAFNPRLNYAHVRPSARNEDK